MKTKAQLEKEHKQAIKTLQANCPHTKLSPWYHLDDDVTTYSSIIEISGTILLSKECLNCSKIVKTMKAHKYRHSAIEAAKKKKRRKIS
jgi:hypothetical protein